MPSSALQQLSTRQRFETSATWPVRVTRRCEAVTILRPTLDNCPQREIVPVPDTHPVSSGLDPRHDPIQSWFQGLGNLYSERYISAGVVVVNQA